MTLTVPELIERLAAFDEVDLIELLNLTSYDILNRCEDLVEDNYDKLIREVI
jgi:hypothetical protein